MRDCTRRTVLASLAVLRSSPAARKPRLLLPSERYRYADPSTEIPVVRLTDPAHFSLLPPPPARAIERHGGFLVYASDHGGSLQAWRMDVRRGGSEQLTETRALDGNSLNLLPDDRNVLFFDGPSLRLLDLARQREREVYRVPDGSTHGAGLAVAGDGSRAVFIEERNGVSRLRLVRLPKGEESTVLESPAPLGEPVLGPSGERILYRREGGLWVVGSAGQDNRRLALAPGRAGRACWSPDGGSVLYLNFPAAPHELNSIRQANPQTGAECLVAPTSQYADFSPNGDASVFVGASGNRGAPYILLLLRITRRELALCEHRAGDASRVAPVFSPDSQRIFFQSDRHGKPAIYLVGVDRLVARTD